MSDWPARDVTVFGLSSGQHWMLIALALIAIGIFVTRKLDQ
jgi:hypothetical protein